MSIISKLPLGASGKFFKLIFKLPKVLRYYTLIGIVFIFKNVFYIMNMVKTQTATSHTLLGKVFVAFMVVFKIFAKKAIVFDVGIYQATKQLQTGTLPVLIQVNVLTNVLLGFAVFFLLVYVIIRVDALAHSGVIGLGSIMVGLLLLYFVTGYYGVKWTGNIHYTPFQGMFDFFKLIWTNPNVLKPVLQNGLW